MPVARRTPLPTGPATGRLLVAEQVVSPTSIALQASSGSHVPHEGLVLWLGRVVGDDVLVVSCSAPPTEHHRDGVFVGERAVARVARSARAAGVSVVAQVHSHPDTDTRHSDGDDTLVLMPFEGMFSLVVGEYGQGSLLPQHGATLHQFQGGRWVRITEPTLTILPPAIGIGALR